MGGKESGTPQLDCYGFEKKGTQPDLVYYRTQTVPQLKGYLLSIVVNPSCVEVLDEFLDDYIIAGDDSEDETNLLNTFDPNDELQFQFH